MASMSVATVALYSASFGGSGSLTGAFVTGASCVAGATVNAVSIRIAVALHKRVEHMCMLLAHPRPALPVLQWPHGHPAGSPCLSVHGRAVIPYVVPGRLRLRR